MAKQAVRALAAEWGLPIWDKPAAPCLSSRIAYGEEVTPERLAMIDQAEQYLRGLGLRELRVRYHRGDMARLEVPPQAIEQNSASRKPATRLVAELRRLGFRYITLDLEGFRIGSQNLVLMPPPARRALSGGRAVGNQRTQAKQTRWKRTSQIRCPLLKRNSK